MIMAGKRVGGNENSNFESAARFLYSGYPRLELFIRQPPFCQARSQTAWQRQGGGRGEFLAIDFTDGIKTRRVSLSRLRMYRISLFHARTQSSDEEKGRPRLWRGRIREKSECRPADFACLLPETVESKRRTASRRRERTRWKSFSGNHVTHSLSNRRAWSRRPIPFRSTGSTRKMYNRRHDCGSRWGALIPITGIAEQRQSTA